MDEGLRRQYLKAMEITVWQRRDLPRPPTEVADTPLDPAREERMGDEGERIHHSSIPPGSPPVSGGVSAGKISQDRQVSPPPTAAETQMGSQPTRRSTEQAHAAVSDIDWDELRREVKNCSACGLRAGCTQTVFGVGDTQADLLVIGEAPGADEDRQGEPFVGRAGQLLNAMLLAMGLKREQVFIANIVKCRPPENRDPKADEALRCEPYLLRQIELIRPRVILSVGRISAQNLLKTEIAVGKLRGRVHPFGEQRVPLVVTYHPAYLLRSPEQKGKAWEDMQLVLSLLNSPLQ